MHGALRYDPSPAAARDLTSYPHREEIEIWLRDRLRHKRFYEWLRSIHVKPSENHSCGWAASVRGEFTHVEQDDCRATIVELQRHFSLRVAAKPAW